MKKGSTIAATQSRNISRQQLTIGLDLGDRNSADGSMATVANSAGTEKILDQEKSQRTYLTPTGLLMEGDFTQNPNSRGRLC